MRITLCALMIIVGLLISNLCLAFDHLSCKEFISLPEKEKVLVSHQTSRHLPPSPRGAISSHHREDNPQGNSLRPTGEKAHVNHAAD